MALTAPKECIREASLTATDRPFNFDHAVTDGRDRHGAPIPGRPLKRARSETPPEVLVEEALARCEHTRATTDVSVHYNRDSSHGRKKVTKQGPPTVTAYLPHPPKEISPVPKPSRLMDPAARMPPRPQPDDLHPLYQHKARTREEQGRNEANYFATSMAAAIQRGELSPPDMSPLPLPPTAVIDAPPAPPPEHEEARLRERSPFPTSEDYLGPTPMGSHHPAAAHQGDPAPLPSITVNPWAVPANKGSTHMSGNCASTERLQLHTDIAPPIPSQPYTSPDKYAVGTLTATNAKNYIPPWQMPHANQHTVQVAHASDALNVLGGGYGGAPILPYAADGRQVGMAEPWPARTVAAAAAAAAPPPPPPAAPQGPVPMEGITPSWIGQEDDLVPTTATAACRTPAPAGGWPVTYAGDPEAGVQGSDRERLATWWRYPAETSALLNVFGELIPSREDVWTRRNQIHKVICDALGDDSLDFFIVAPEIADTTENSNLNEHQCQARSRPATPYSWFLTGLLAEHQRALVNLEVLSSPEITVIIRPRILRFPRLLMSISFPRISPDEARDVVRRNFERTDIRNTIARFIVDNPRRNHEPLEVAVQRIIDSIEVTTYEISQGTTVANVLCDSPAASIPRHRQWRAALDNVRFKSAVTTTGYVRPVRLCHGCHMACHPTHLCPYPDILGWNGPDFRHDNPPNTFPPPPGNPENNRKPRGGTNGPPQRRDLAPPPSWGQSPRRARYDDRWNDPYVGLSNGRGARY